MTGGKITLFSVYTLNQLTSTTVAMTDLANDLAAHQVAELLTHYSFDLGGYAAEDLVGHWLLNYPASWLRSAVVEALYQGRYKAFSVGQILTLWKRRGHPIYHFNHEFERIICGKFSKNQIPLAHSQAGSSSGYASPELNKPNDSSRANLDWSDDMAAFDEEAIALPSTQTTSNQSTSDLDAVASDLVSVDTAEGITEAADTLAAAIPTATDAMDREATSPLLSSSQPGVEDARSVELPIQPFKPTIRSIDIPGQRASWSRVEAAKHPIHQFIPTTTAPSFCAKLKAVAQHETDSQSEKANLLLG